MVSDRISVDLRIRAERAEQALKEQEKAWKETNEDLLKKEEILSKEKANNEEEHAAEIDEVIAEVKRSVVVVVWEAKVKLAEDVASAGSQNLVVWHEALAKLTGKPVNTSHDPEGKQQKAGKEEKALGNDNQSTVYAQFI